MKRILAILLVAILAFTLISCNSTSTTASPSASAPVSPSASAPASAEPSPSPSASAVPSEKDTIGYVTDKADHFNREPFKIGILYYSTAATFLQNINDNLVKWGKVLNFDLTVYSANMDGDALVNQITTMADQGYEGLIVGADSSILDRVIEVCKETKLPYLGSLTALTDKDGNCVWPSVGQDEYGNGALCMNWLAENYKNYWKDPIDESKLGLIILDFSVVAGIHERVAGVYDEFIKAFPDAAANYYAGDLLTIENGFSSSGGNLMTSTIMAGHPEITKWFVVGLVDDWAVGATRAVEALNKQDSVLVASIQADAFLTEMASGYQGDVYVGACAISPAEVAGYLGANLVTILEGRATAETIWPEWIAPGSSYANLKIVGTMITKDTYKDWVQNTSFEALSAGMKTS